MDSKLGRKHRVTCRTKTAKIVLVGNGGHLENLFFTSSPTPGGPVDLKLGRNHLGDLEIKNS